MSIHVPADVRDDLLARALRWFNGERVLRLGLEPLDELPKAEPHSPSDCLICEALGGEGIITCNRWYRDEFTGRQVALPDYVAAVACAFDEGAFPELILSGTERFGVEWRPARQNEVQAIIDRLAAEIRAARETAPETSSRPAVPMPVHAGRAPFPCRGVAGERPESLNDDTRAVRSDSGVTAHDGAREPAC